MKHTKNIFVTTIIFLLATISCSQTKKSADTTTTAPTDSIVATIKLIMTKPDPPYSAYDSTVTWMFASQKDFRKWKSKNGSKIISFQTKKK